MLGCWFYALGSPDDSAYKILRCETNTTQRCESTAGAQKEVFNDGAQQQPFFLYLKHVYMPKAHAAGAGRDQPQLTEKHSKIHGELRASPIRNLTGSQMPQFIITLKGCLECFVFHEILCSLFLKCVYLAQSYWQHWVSFRGKAFLMSHDGLCSGPLKQT